MKESNKCDYLGCEKQATTKALANDGTGLEYDSCLDHHEDLKKVSMEASTWKSTQMDCLKADLKKQGKTKVRLFIDEGYGNSQMKNVSLLECILKVIKFYYCGAKMKVTISLPTEPNHI